MSYKWTLYDGTTTFHFAYNPDAMTAPYRSKNLTVSTAQLQTTMAPKIAKEWTVSGFIYSSAEYTNLITWHQKDIVLQLTDHLARVWDVISEDLNIKERRPSASNPNRYTYDWKFLNLGLNDGSL